MANNIPVHSAAFHLAGRSLSDPRVAPDDSRVAFLTTSPTRAELAVVSLHSFASINPDQAQEMPETWLPLDPGIAKCSPADGGQFAWSEHGCSITYMSSDNTLCRFDLRNERTSELCLLGESPSALAYAQAIERVAWVDDLQTLKVAHVTQDNCEPRVIATASDFVADPDWDASGSALVWLGWNDPNMPWQSSQLFVCDDIATNHTRVIAGGEGTSVQQPRYSPDGKYLAFLSDETGWLNLWLMEANALEYKMLLFGERCEHGDSRWGNGMRTFAWSRDAKHIYLRRNVGGFGQLVKIEVDSGVCESLDGVWASGLDAGRDGVACVVSDWRRTGDVAYIFDKKETKTRCVLASASPYNTQVIGQQPIGVEWQSSDNQTLHGRLHISPVCDEHAKGLIVWLHGGPTSQSPATAYAKWSFFLERGWSIFVPDYRGSTGWGRAYADALQGNWGVTDVEDVLDGLHAARSNNWMRGGPIVLLGGSAGGFTALNVLARSDRGCAAGVVMYPVVDLVATAETTWRFEQHYTDSLIGPLADVRETYVARSPLSVAHKIAVPLLVLHGEDDQVVSADQS